MGPSGVIAAMDLFPAALEGAGSNIRGYEGFNKGAGYGKELARRPQGPKTESMGKIVECRIGSGSKHAEQNKQDNRSRRGPSA